MSASHTSARTGREADNEQGDARQSAVSEEQTPSSDIERLKSELKECQDRYLRAMAENQNTARRMNEERQTALRYAEGDFAKSLLPIVDNFERLIVGLGPEQTTDPFMQGVKLVYDMLCKALAEHNVRQIESENKAFDPRLHEAISRESSARAAPGTVVKEYQKGYMILDRVLRPAKVGIATAPEPKAASGGEPDER